MMKFIIFSALVAIAAAAVSETQYGDEYTNYKFESWRREHNYDFQPFEYVERLSMFRSNDKMIKEHNAGDSTYTMGHNQFSHLSNDEWKAMMGFTGVPTAPFREINDFAGVTAANDIDWTTKGAVTPVKNQGQCGSCWAFSTTGALEGEYFLKNQNLKSFSEQQLVDCDHNGDQGCNGGLMDNAFDFIKSNGGICSESDYPYKGVGGTCKKSCSVVTGTAPSHTDVAQTKAALESAITQQPVAIAIEADQSGFQFYSKGVFTGACGSQLDHGVLAVGFGTESGTDYWKVKNSWGTTWGDRGYIKLQRGKAQSGGQCGILKSASYPTL
jgi:C1A family cysteine protease